MNMLAQWNGITDNIIVHLLTSLIYIIGANFVFDMQLSVGSVFAFITYSAYVTGPISAILNIGYLLSGIIPSTKRYYEFMALEEEKENEDGRNDQIVSYGISAMHKLPPFSFFSFSELPFRCPCDGDRGREGARDRRRG